MKRRYEVSVFRAQLFAVAVALMLVGAVMAAQRGLRTLLADEGPADARLAAVAATDDMSIFYRWMPGRAQALRCVVFANGDWALYRPRVGEPVAFRTTGLTPADVNLDAGGMKAIATAAFDEYTGRVRARREA